MHILLIFSGATEPPIMKGAGVVGGHPAYCGPIARISPSGQQPYLKITS